MTTKYDEQRDAFGRQVQMLVEIDIDRCGNIIGTTPCTVSPIPADGSRCWYSFPSCQKPTNFTRTVQTYYFCLNHVPWTDWATPAWPLLKSFVSVPQKVDAKKLDVWPEVVTIEMLNCPLPPAPDHDKGAGKYNTEAIGEFWKNLIARSPNYKGRPLRIKYGFSTVGFALADFRQEGPQYTIQKIDVKRDGITITAESPLAKLRTRRLPFSVSEDNVLTADVDVSVTTWPVNDGSQYPDPADYSRVHVYVECESEIAEVTSISGNDLTVVRGRAGTAAATHVTGKKVKHVVLIGTDNGASAMSGTQPTEAMQDLLEWAGFSIASDVNVTSFDDLKTGYWPDADIQKTARKPKTVAQHMLELREPRGIILFMTSDGKFSVQAMAPTTSATDITEAHIITGTLRISEDEGSRLTRAIVMYDPVDEGNTKPENFQKWVMVVDDELENVNFFDGIRDGYLVDPWVYDQATVGQIANFGRRFLIRRKGGIRRIQFDVDIKNGEMEIGDSVLIETSLILGLDGQPDPRTCIIVAKSYKKEAVIRYTAEDVNMGGRPLRIGPDTMVDNYDSATEDKQYGYWGDETNNRVGARKELGYQFI